VTRRTLRIAFRLALFGLLGYAVATRLRRDNAEPALDAPTWPALTPAPPRLEQAPARAWVSPSSDGICPQTHPIKAKQSSRIFHLPGMFAYDRTNPDRCYAAEPDAVTDGFRKAKR
jgi:hypothetical protein